MYIWYLVLRRNYNSCNRECIRQGQLTIDSSSSRPRSHRIELLHFKLTRPKSNRSFTTSNICKYSILLTAPSSVWWPIIGVWKWRHFFHQTYGTSKMRDVLINKLPIGTSYEQNWKIYRFGDKRIKSAINRDGLHDDPSLNTQTNMRFSYNKSIK